MSDERLSIDAPEVARIVAAQFPHWAGLSVRPMPRPGWDNLSFRLGENLVLRMPSAARYVAQVEKEQRWLPILARHLPLEVPVPVATGHPGRDYPFPFSINRWIEGIPLAAADGVDQIALARDLARFLKALYRVDVGDAPMAGKHNFYRGCPPAVYDSQTRKALRLLDGQIDTVLAGQVWEAALAARFTGAPCWLHGDVSAGNLIMREGKLAAVIDFGTCGVGDPACDFYIAWTYFGPRARGVFRSELGLDESAWARGRGWALWKALLICSGMGQTNVDEHQLFMGVIADILADYARNR